MPRTTAKEDRKARKPMGGRELKLEAPERKGYVRRWVNDQGNRIMRFREGGYEFVEDETTVEGTERDPATNRVRQVVGTQANGEPLYAYLMEQRKKFYDEDQKAKADAIEEQEAALKRGIDQRGAPGDGTRYVPRDGIKFEEGSGTA